MTLAAPAQTPDQGAPEPLAPGYQGLEFKPPKPGGYQLQDLGAAADAQLLDSNGSRTTLKELMRGKITVISFIYSSCNEVNGCPLATSILQRTHESLKTSPEVLAKVRLLTVSFDPTHDTPKVMARYAQPFIRSGADWHFLTLPPSEDLTGLLSAYQQSITPEIDAQGKSTGRISHLLRVMLIDPELRIRNSYTPSVLHADLLVADIQSLAMGLKRPDPIVGAGTMPPKTALLRPGDDKTRYEQTDYQTQSASLPQRIGKTQDLIGLIASASLGLPKDPDEAVSPLAEKRVALGRRLFYDRRLSLNGTFSCAMCHIPEQGFTSQEQSTAIGIEGRTVRRNAPTILNVGRLNRFFHDGREDRLENQVWGPFLAANEMGNPSVGQVLDKLKQFTDYKGLFNEAFGKGPTMDTVGEALSQYERTLVAGSSPFDQWHFGGHQSAIGRDARQGYALFVGKAGCSQCHTLGKTEAILTDQAYHNTGIGYSDAMDSPGQTTRVQLAPGMWTDLDTVAIARVSEKKPADLGRYEVTQNPDDRWKYRTPSLRNIALTAPYMHNGSIRTLEEVVHFYQRGGIKNPGLDPLIHPLNLNPSEVKALVAFLKSLTGEGVSKLIEDAWAAPIGDPKGNLGTLTR